MKRKVLCFLMGMLVLLLPGCQSEQEDLYSQALSDSSAVSSEAASDEAKKELTVLVSYDNTQLNGLAEEYEAAHPDVTINIEVGLSSAGQGGEDWNDFVERVTTELLSGEGPDLLVDPGAFPSRTISPPTWRTICGNGWRTTRSLPFRITTKTCLRRSPSKAISSPSP